MLTKDRNTEYRDGQLVVIPVANGAVIHAGAIVCADANGYATPGASATGLTYLGRAEEAVDNSAGQDGDRTVTIRRKVSFRFANSATDPVTQASLGKRCYIEDDETVAATDGSDAGATPAVPASRSAAGIVIELAADGVWVE